MGLSEDIARVAADLPGRLGVAVRFMKSGEDVFYHADDVFPSASVIKVAILAALYQAAHESDIGLDDRLEVPATRVEGSGVLRHLGAGLTPTARDLAWLMITISDNAATNMLIAALGVERINHTITQLGLTATTLHRPISFDVSGHFAETTPRDMMRLLDLLATETTVGTEMAVGGDASNEMLSMLKECQGTDGIPRHLPIHDRDATDGPPSIEIAHKTGSIDGVRNDVGIVYLNDAVPPCRYILSVLTADVADDALWTPENIATRAVADVSRLVYQAAREIAGS